MKGTLLLVFASLGALVGASPAANPLEQLQPRDKYCRLHDDVTPPGHCRACTSTDCRNVRNVARNDRIGVRCYVNGDRANNNQRWDYVPGWNCYISASITNPGCEDGIGCCNSACAGSSVCMRDGYPCG